MNKLCELCHRYFAVMVCEQCGAAICSLCSDLLENDPEDVTTWVILCSECSVSDEPVLLLPYQEGHRDDKTN